MYEHSEEWLRLTQEWLECLKKAKVRQAVIDDKMQSFLKGNGCLPTPDELKQVEDLWAQHVRARNKTNDFVAVVIRRYAHVTPP